jgi:hydroxymethylbilane synthase
MLIIGSRGSALALAQTSWVKEQIFRHFPEAELAVKVIKTSADRDATASIRSGSAIGVFVKELEQALVDGEIDLAVHSMKDLPTRIPPGLRIGAVPEREDARDALVSATGESLSKLPEGARVGTGSLRRQAQILARRPDLKIMEIRGNIDTRLKKLEDGAYDAVVLACAGLNRLGLQNRIVARLSLQEMLPAPGQGALAIEARANDRRLEPIAAALNHPATSAAVAAERSFLQRMGGGCNVPVAVHARLTGSFMEIDGLVASPDGRRIVRDSVRGSADGAQDAAVRLAEEILARGGRVILDALQQEPGRS